MHRVVQRRPPLGGTEYRRDDDFLAAPPVAPGSQRCAQVLAQASGRLGRSQQFDAAERGADQGIEVGQLAQRPTGRAGAFLDFLGGQTVVADLDQDVQNTRHAELGAR